MILLKGDDKFYRLMDLFKNRKDNIHSSDGSIHITWWKDQFYDYFYEVYQQERYSIRAEDIKRRFLDKLEEEYAVSMLGYTMILSVKK